MQIPKFSVTEGQLQANLKSLMKKVGKIATRNHSIHHGTFHSHSNNQPPSALKPTEFSKESTIGQSKLHANMTAAQGTAKPTSQEIRNEMAASLQLTSQQQAKEIALLQQTVRELRREKLDAQALLERQEQTFQRQMAMFEKKMEDAVKVSGSLGEQLDSHTLLTDKMNRKYQKKKSKVVQLKTCLKIMRGELDTAKQTIDLFKNQLTEANRKNLSGLEELQAECSEVAALRTRVFLNQKDPGNGAPVDGYGKPDPSDQAGGNQERQLHQDPTEPNK